MTPRALRHGLRFCLPLSVMALIWFLSSLPAKSFPSWSFDLLQSAAHIVIFALLAASWYWALLPLSRAPLLWAFALSVGYGAVDELHQIFVPGRVSSLADLLCDAIGAALALVLWSMWQRSGGDRRAVSGERRVDAPPEPASYTH